MGARRRRPHRTRDRARARTGAPADAALRQARAAFGCLEFEIDSAPSAAPAVSSGHQIRLTITAYSRAQGVWGLRYRYALAPAHGFIFRRMTRAMMRRAEQVGAEDGRPPSLKPGRDGSSPWPWPRLSRYAAQAITCATGFRQKRRSLAKLLARRARGFGCRSGWRRESVADLTKPQPGDRRAADRAFFRPAEEPP